MTIRIKQLQGTLVDYLNTRYLDGFDTLRIRVDDLMIYTILVDVEQFPTVSTLRYGDVFTVGIDDTFEVHSLEIEAKHVQL